MNKITIEKVFELGEKYDMEITEIIALKQMVILGIITLGKCLSLGLEKEIYDEYQETINKPNS